MTWGNTYDHRFETIIMIIEFMKTHMDHAEIINISIEMEREFKFLMFTPSELKLIRHQFSISYGKQV